MTPTRLPACEAALSDPREFQSTAEGSGVFGRWMLDCSGLPAYRYEIDQYKDRRAYYPNTEWYDRRDHWHQIGNDRVNALASNDGTVQLYLCDRGGVFLNRFEAAGAYEGIRGVASGILRWLLRRYRQFRARRIAQTWRETMQPRGSPMLQIQMQQRQTRLTPGGGRILRFQAARLLPRTAPGLRDWESARHTHAGGFGYLDDGVEVWATAFRYRPPRAETRRVFGMGYFETETTYRNIRVIRHVYAPYGNDPMLLIDVHIENLSTETANLRYYEYWDVNVHQLKVQLMRTGLFAAANDDNRRALSEHFTPHIEWDDRQHAWRFHQQPPDGAPPPDQVNVVDWAPADVFLADLTGGPPDAGYCVKSTFFGKGGPRQPDAVRTRRDSDISAPSTDDPMPYCMVLQRDLRLEPHASARLRYAYGATRPEDALDFLAAYRDGDLLARTRDRWRKSLAYFSTGNDPVLQREMAWHSYNLLSATVYQDYYKTHLVPQGSAYLYLHGMDGAPRDQSLFTLPLVYLRPDLARDTLRLIMSLTHADTGAIPYAFAGYGAHGDATIHAHPSDLDLFFLLALSEYLAATGHMAFLDEEVPFYPRGARPALPDGTPLGTTVLDHVRVAVMHLIDKVGIGEHGLFRIGDGDWSDGVVVEAVTRDPFGVTFEDSRRDGESVPNTQMALHVLPLAAALIEKRDPILAKRMRDRLPELKQAVARQWSRYGDWYIRAVLRNGSNGSVTVGDEQINLEAQPWALISGSAAESGKEAQLIDSITRLLDDPSPIGAPSIKGGTIWPAISQLLTWGYTRSRPDLAWRSLKRNTFAEHAKVFPHIWFNIWSGPDAINAEDAANPGGTWASEVTSMTDFPAMNANPHAMALLGLLRVCGVEPAPNGDGLIIAPKAPPERFILDLPLLRLDVAPGRIAGEYRAEVDGCRMLYIRVPEEATEILAGVDGRRLDAISRGKLGVALELVFKASQTVPFEVRWIS